MTQNGKYGVKETLDIIVAASEVKEAIVEAKSDNGKVDAMELPSILVRAFQPVTEAIKGAIIVPKELNELSDEELIILREAGYGELIEDENYAEAIFYLSGFARAVDKIVDARRVKEEVEPIVEKAVPVKQNVKPQEDEKALS